MVASYDRQFHVTCKRAFWGVLALAAVISAVPGSAVLRHWHTLKDELADLLLGCMIWLESTVTSGHLTDKWAFGALIMLILVFVRFYSAFNRVRLDTERFVSRVEDSAERPVPMVWPDILRSKVRVFTNAAPFCFTSGLLHPQVLVSTGFIELLEAEELEAALHHEHYHVIHRDPLKILICRSLVDALRPFPMVRDLAERYLVDKELAADQFAAACCGDGCFLSSALVKLLRAGTQAEPRAVAAFSGTNQLRVQCLLGQAVPPRRWFRLRSVWQSVAATVVLLPAAAAVGWAIDAVLSACARGMAGF